MIYEKIVFKNTMRKVKKDDTFIIFWNFFQLILKNSSMATDFRSSQPCVQAKSGSEQSTQIQIRNSAHNYINILSDQEVLTNFIK